MIIKNSKTIHFAFVDTDIILKRSHSDYYSMYVDQRFHSLISIHDVHKVIRELKKLNKDYGSKLYQPYYFKDLK